MYTNFQRCFCLVCVYKKHICTSYMSVCRVICVQSYMCTVLYVYRVICVQSYMCTELYVYRVICVQSYMCTELYVYRVICVQSYMCTELYVYRVICVQSYMCAELYVCVQSYMCTELYVCVQSYAEFVFRVMCLYVCVQSYIIGISPPHITDVSWRLQYQIKSNQLYRHNRPDYLINLTVESSDANQKPEISFDCSMEQLQDLLGKLRDAAKSLERTTQM
ncbi:hypothetical protein XELAEV_18030789mg [Xenopus laevis]|uniref:COMM domain-containing protein 3 n=1 Tax=Xenopus laevis TaxID=8355 RepID=A0A974HF27_XENLA|nr:hypothetical protein XELAEV_18030789mg [Xenopus laevis]